jgi:hypothetical protein
MAKCWGEVRSAVPAGLDLVQVVRGQEPKAEEEGEAECRMTSLGRSSRSGKK